ncbi:MAG: hypothetical protein N2558_02475 [Patescibacteria group bacterium]|nr:hypothetical protein [Patescibacteria group bacterium]
MQNAMDPDSEPFPNQNAENENAPAQGQKAEDANKQQEIREAALKLLSYIQDMKTRGGKLAEIAKGYESIRKGENFADQVVVGEIPKQSKTPSNNAEVYISEEGLIQIRIDSSFILKRHNPAYIYAVLAEEWSHFRDLQEIANKEGKPRSMNEEEHLESEIRAKLQALEAYKQCKEEGVGSSVRFLDELLGKIESVKKQREEGKITEEEAREKEIEIIIKHLQEMGYEVAKRYQEREMLKKFRKFLEEIRGKPRE